MELRCWLCDRPLSKEDKDRDVPTEYKKNGEEKPCEHCYNHMNEVDFLAEEWP